MNQGFVDKDPSHPLSADETARGLLPAKERPTVAYYVTAHGYGHGVRSCDILRALAARGAKLSVVSKLDPDFLRSRLAGTAMDLRAKSFDVGMVQLDSIRVDLSATEARLAELLKDWDALVRQEEAFFAATRPDLVVCDIPAIPFQAARALGIPTVAVSNFTWSWIYSEFANRPGAESVWEDVIQRFRDAYSQVDLLLRLPFSEPMEVFPKREDLPLLTTPSTPDRTALASLTGADPEKRWVLLSFTSLDWGPEAIAKVTAFADVEFFTVKPLEWPGSGIHSIDREKHPFGQVLASVDAVLSKPGYGIVSECVAHQKPLLYADRDNFLEYPILVEAIERYLPQAHIPSEELYAGNLEDGLRRVFAAAAPPDTLPLGGADVAAGRMFELMAQN